jgi:hypothetical protein
MVDQLSHEGVRVILVWNRKTWDGFPEPWLGAEDGKLIFNCNPDKVPVNLVHTWGDAPVNLSKMWNMGLDFVEKVAGDEEFVVAVFNDDLTLPPGLVQSFADKLQQEGSSAVYAHSTMDLPNMTNHVPWHLGNRMVGFAFALRGSDGLRADEDFLWWWGDTDLDLRARSKRGVCALGVPALQHHDPNGYTNRRPELAAQAGRDRETFARKHGYVPW